MFYNQRELRRLWKIEVYEGDPNDPDVTVRTETIVAWNQVDAIRHAGGKLAVQPEALYFVTWPDNNNQIYRINDTSGPIGEPIEPSIGIKIIEDENWK